MICVGVLGRTGIPKLINILVFACLLCVPPLNSWQKKKKSKIRCTSNTWAEFDSRHVLCSEKKKFYRTAKCFTRSGISLYLHQYSKTGYKAGFLIWPYAESEVEYTMCINTAWSYKAPTQNPKVGHKLHVHINSQTDISWVMGLWLKWGKRTTPSCNPYS